MKLLRLSPSKVEKYRQYNEDEYNGFITKEKLIEGLKGEEVWTPKAEFGSAFHLVLQFGANKYYNRKTGYFHIKDDQMPEEVIVEYSEIELADQYHKAHPHMVWEVKNKFDYVLDGQYQITFNMRFDAMAGLRVKEHKTTSRAFDYDFYYRSLQWKVYLLSSQCQSVSYEVFPYSEYAGKPRVVRHESMTFYPSPSVAESLNINLRGLIRFCDINGLMEHIQPKSYEKEGIKS